MTVLSLSADRSEGSNETKDEDEVEDEDEDEVRDEVEGEFIDLGVFGNEIFSPMCGEIVSPSYSLCIYDVPRRLSVALFIA